MNAIGPATAVAAAVSATPRIGRPSCEARDCAPSVLPNSGSELEDRMPPRQCRNPDDEDDDHAQCWCGQLPGDRLEGSRTHWAADIASDNSARRISQ